MQNARPATHRYLYAVANSNAMNGVDADTTVKNIIPIWQYGYVALVVFVAVMWFFGVKAVRALWASKRYLAKKAERKAKETLEIYAPIAHRLGLNQCYRELQETSFRFLSPWRHAALSKAVGKARLTTRPPCRPAPGRSDGRRGRVR